MFPSVQEGIGTQAGQAEERIQCKIVNQKGESVSTPDDLDHP